jgi:RraA family protein
MAMVDAQVNSLPPLAARDLVDGFREISTPLISDNLARLPGAVGLRQFHRSGRMVGTALTVKTRSGDNLAIHQALNIARPGDVIVVDGEGDLGRAVVGDLMKAIAESRGVAGFVIDGAIRDVDAFAAGDFPCFARGVIHRGPYKDGPGELNVPVSIGGMTVRPGDLVVGDENGVIAFPQDIARDLLGLVRAQEQRERAMLEEIQAGRYDGRYGRPAAAK